MSTLTPARPATENLKRLQTSAFFVAFIALGLAFAALGPTLPGLAENTGASLSQISVLFAAQSLGLLVGNFLSGWVIDRTPAHPFLAVVVILIAAMLAFTPFVASLWLLASAMFLIGLGVGAVDVSGNTLLVWIHGDRVGPAMNALHFFFGVGALLAPIFVAQAIALTGDITWAYWLLALLVLPAALLFLRLPSPAAPLRIAQARSERTPRLLVGLMATLFFLFVGAEVSFGGWIYTYAVTLNLATATTAGYLTSLFWGAMTLGRLLSIRLAGRARPRYILLADLIGAAACLSLLLLVPGSGWVVWAASFGVGLSLANVYPTLVLLGRNHLHLTGSITSMFLVGGSLGSMVLPWLIGQRFEVAGPQITMAIILATVALAGGVLEAFLVASRRRARTQPGDLGPGLE